jgi:hypothetical protein
MNPSKENTLELHDFYNSNCGRDVDTRRSMTSYVFFFEGTTISWANKKQATIAFSFIEAEYMAFKQQRMFSNLKNS